MWRSKALLPAALVLVLMAPLACRKESPAAVKTAAEPAHGKKVLYWYDPMKPEVHFDKPGKSPFMDMDLQPKYAAEPAAPGGAPLPAGLSVVRIPLERRQEIGVST